MDDHRNSINTATKLSPSLTTQNRKLHVAFCTVPMMGHLMPLLPYAEELLQRGHNVTFFHAADPKYRTKIEDCGLGGIISVAYETKTSKHGDIYDAMLTYFEQNKSAPVPDLIVYDFFAVDGADVADRLGVPALGIFPNPRSVNPWAATVQEQDTWQWKLWSTIVMNGLESVLARVLWCVRTKTRWSRSLPVLAEQDLYPSPYMSRPMLGSMALELDNLPNAPLFHTVGPSLTNQVDPIPDDLQRWMAGQERPIVLVAFGTMYKYSAEVVQDLYTDLQNSGAAVIWSLPPKAQELLPNGTTTMKNNDNQLCIQSFVPQVALLQSGQISAFVTHCGSNSMNEALLAGVPMVCCPGFADQPANATRLARAGVGVIAKKTKKKPPNGRGSRIQTLNVGPALKTVFGDNAAMKRTCQTVARELKAMQAEKRGVDIMEEIAAAAKSSQQIRVKGRWSWLWTLAAVTATVVFLVVL